MADNREIVEGKQESGSESDDEAVEPAEDAAGNRQGPRDMPTSTGENGSGSSLRQAIYAGLAFVVALSGLAGWLGFGAYGAYQSAQQREKIVAAGRQAAVNLTTVDYRHVDSDTQRILESATGSFLDEYSKRSKPFTDVVKQAQSTSVGSVTAAGLESQSGNTAQVLVAVSVRTTIAGSAEQEPRLWRMRISVQRVGDQTKVSDVQFVP